MHAIRIVLAVVTASLFAAHVPAAPYDPWTYRQDFEVRNNAGWSSYPPIQDAAYAAIQGQKDPQTALNDLQTKLQTLIK